jgi:hypothetical protein
VTQARRGQQEGWEGAGEQGDCVDMVDDNVQGRGGARSIMTLGRSG